MKVVIVTAVTILGFAAVEAAALDVENLKAVKLPASGSVDEARICAAVMSNTAFVVQNNGRPDAETAKKISDAFTKISYMWVDLGADRSNEDRSKYASKTLSVDMDSLMAMGPEINQAYFTHCMPISEKHLKNTGMIKP